MRILITGNMGYVGPGVVAQLRRTYPEAHLVGLDHGWFAHCLTSRAVLPEILLDEQRFGDVRKVTRQDLEGFDAVVHLAAVSNDPMGNRFATVTDAINHRASVHLARVAAAAGVKRFVFASSCSIYGFAADGQPRTERRTRSRLSRPMRARRSPRRRAWPASTATWRSPACALPPPAGSRPACASTSCSTTSWRAR
jgi:nucleoside-diphosphate-sugar epimerase